MGSPLASSRPSQSLRRLERIPPPSSSTVSNHVEMISSSSPWEIRYVPFRFLFCLFCVSPDPLDVLYYFSLQGVVLQCYKELLSSYEKVSGSSSLAGQLEGELKGLKKEKAREDCILQCRLKNLAGKHATLQEKYVASVSRTEAVRAELEGMQAEKDSTHSSYALERTICAVQARLKEADLEVPATL
ncbi:hypothetical protein LIER_30766 [Lithospermum erythrorhizon]|uniref:Uncharacterized protein n=1 Tax=Lithospermum erythrorhizon TaxID=34254 RepID=A0AAV3RR44_LITER